MTFWTKRAALAAALACALAACGDDEAPTDEPGADAQADAAADADAGDGEDGGEDTAEDAASDGTTDGGDTSSDAGADTSADTGADTTADTSDDTSDDASAPPPTVTMPSAEGLVPASIVREHACSVRYLPDGADDTAWLPTLADSGCYAISDDAAVPVDAALEYFVRVPLWADYAGKGRYLYLPPEGTLTWSATTSFGFPEGTVILKEFWIDNTLIESRFLELDEGTWVAATYEWNEDHTDATLVEVGKELTVGDDQWFLPSPDDCMLCHTRSADFVLGLRGDQMFTAVDMFGLGEVNQMAAYDALGLFDEPLPEEIELLPLAPLDDPDASLDHRVRSYFASNCANCHQPGGAPHADIDLRITTDLADSRACDVYPLEGDFGLRGDARIIAPGEPDNSVLLLRMATREDGKMPQLGTFVAHDAAVDEVRAWIASMDEECAPVE